MTCTDEQIRMLLKYAKTSSQEIAAAKAGMSLSSAKRYLTLGRKRKKVKQSQRSWRTRKDPFEGVWHEVVELLQRDTGLEAKTIMEWLIGQHPGQFQEGQVRTLRRRIKDWRVLEGPESKEVFFRQNIQPGRQSQSDYTHCNSLEISVAGSSFPHMLYHFMLPYSRWEFVWICFTESFETLTTGYNKAVLDLGAVAPEHRTDNLAAAVPIGESHSFQERWKDFLAHHGAMPSANNPGCSNENGSVEKSHDLFKNALNQRLMIRGNREFETLEQYEDFLKEMTADRNKLRKERLAEELKILIPLPVHKWDEPKQYSALVTGWSTINVERAVYSVQSRFIGQKLKVFVYYDRLKIFYGRLLVEECERQKPGGKCINYRHLIFHLLRKPGAFRNYQFREELFPRKIYRQAYDALRSDNDQTADKEYLRILHHAAVDGETVVASALQQLLEAGKVPAADVVKALYQKSIHVPDVHVFQPKLDAYDKLLQFKSPKEETNK